LQSEPTKKSWLSRYWSLFVLAAAVVTFAAAFLMQFDVVKYSYVRENRYPCLPALTEAELFASGPYRDFQWSGHM